MTFNTLCVTRLKFDVRFSTQTLEMPRDLAAPALPVAAAAFARAHFFSNESRRW
jgi:hypothetical protein